MVDTRTTLTILNTNSPIIISKSKWMLARKLSSVIMLSKTQINNNSQIVPKYSSRTNTNKVFSNSTQTKLTPSFHLNKTLPTSHLLKIKKAPKTSNNPFNKVLHNPNSKVVCLSQTHNSTNIKDLDILLSLGSNFIQKECPWWGLLHLKSRIPSSVIPSHKISVLNTSQSQLSTTLTTQCARDACLNIFKRKNQANKTWMIIRRKL